ncbi:MAG: hypothetical protein JSS66_00940 [Armatimonadetes bacterium]|nr:hypothetical protein [Armatimonadota bacterium]
MWQRTLVFGVAVVLASRCVAQYVPHVLWRSDASASHRFRSVLTPDGSHLVATPSLSNPLWEVALADGGAVSTSMTGGTNCSACFSPDYSRLAVSDTFFAPGVVRIWSWPDQVLIQEIPVPAQVWDMAWLDDTDLLVVGDSSGLYDTTSGVQTQALVPATALALSPDRQLVALLNGPTVTLCRTSDFGIERTITLRDSNDAVAFSPDGSQIALLNISQRFLFLGIGIVDSQTGALVSSWITRSDGASSVPGQICYSADGRYLFAVDSRATAPYAGIYRVSDAQTIAQFSYPVANKTFGCLVTPDGRGIVTTDVKGVQLLENPAMPDETLPLSFNVALGVKLGGNLRSVLAVDLDPLRVAKQIVLDRYGDRVKVDMSSIAPGTGVPSDLRCKVRARLTIDGLFGLYISLFNFQTQQFETILANATITSGFSDFAAVPTGDLSRFLGPGREVKARVSYRSVGPSQSVNSALDIDRAVWRVD